MNSAAMELNPEMTALCRSARSLITQREYSKCFDMLCKAMERHPDNPEPHNLLGILYEVQDDHRSAMRHFRAAHALDPVYIPARENLETYGAFFSYGRCNYGDEPVAE